jgi:hypothetical protein
MASLYTKTKLYLENNSKTWDKTKVKLQNNSDGNGDFIASWDYDIAQPTADQIASYETAGNTAEALQTVLNNRANDYPSIKDQLDKIYHSGIDEWKKVIKTTKDKYPK